MSLPIIFSISGQGLMSESAAPANEGLQATGLGDLLLKLKLQLFQNRKFRAGKIHTHFVDREFDFKDVKADHHEEAAILAAALEFLRREQMTPKYASPRLISPWKMAFREDL